MQLQLSPTDSLDSIADRLALQYAWSAEEHRRHLERLYDIQRTSALSLLHERTLAPLTRTPASIDAYLDGLERRSEAARQLLRALDEH